MCACVCVYEQSNKPHLPYKTGLGRCYAKSPTVQDVFRPIPGLISCAGVAGDGGRHIMHRMQSGGWPYSKVGRGSSKAPFLRVAVLRAAVFRSEILRSCSNQS